jgi:hypothetical protein
MEIYDTPPTSHSITPTTMRRRPLHVACVYESNYELYIEIGYLLATLSYAAL